MSNVGSNETSTTHLPTSDIASGNDHPASVLDLLAGLAGKSLLRVDAPSGDEHRYGMLETIQEYGRERLAAAGEEETVRHRHLAWCVDLAERAAQEIDGADQNWWVHRLNVEHDILRAALGWALARKHGALAQRLAGALPRFWIRRGHVAEGRRWLEQALALETNVPPTVRANALLGMGRLAYSQADYDVGSALEEALALFRAAGDGGGAANVLTALGWMVANLGDYAEASVLEEQALAIFRMQGDHAGVVRVLVTLGLDAYDQGDYERAANLLDEAVSLGRSAGSWYSLGFALTDLALVAQAQGDYDRAMTLQAEALDLWRSLGNVDGIAHGLENVAMFWAAQSAPERAARLSGAADALRVRIGVPGRPIDRAFNERYIAAARAQLGADVFVAARCEGEAMSIEDAIAYALE